MRKNQSEGKMKKSNLPSNKIIKSNICVRVDLLSQHPLHKSIYSEISTTYLEESVYRTGGTPINPVIVVEDNENPCCYQIIAGVNRAESQINSGMVEIDAILIQGITDDLSLKTLIIDLNKQRNKTGRELLLEFRHYCEVYPEKRGNRDGINRYTKIANEIGFGYDKIKDLVTLDRYFKDSDGECVMESVFDPKGIRLLNAQLIKRVIEKYPERFVNTESYERIIDRSFDYKRLEKVVQYINRVC